MADEPSPTEIYERAKEEGGRRLFMSPLEMVSTGFIAGATIVFGVIALGIAESLAAPALGEEAAKLIGAAAFAFGFVFLVIGRSELFTENFFDPVAAALDSDRPNVWLRLGWLWLATLALNLVGGVVVALLVVPEGGLSEGARQALIGAAEEIVSRPWLATLTHAMAAGALLTLFSFLVHAVDSSISRIALAFMVGFLVSVGVFNHAVVTAIHLFFGLVFGDIAAGEAAKDLAVSVAGNILGGVGLMTLTHTAQAKG